VHEGEEDHARPGWTTSRRVDETPVDESLRMTEDGDKWRKYVHSVAKLGSRTAKEQNRHSVAQFNHRDNIHVVTGGLEKSELENVGPNRRGGKGGTGKRGNIMCMGIEM